MPHTALICVEDLRVEACLTTRFEDRGWQCVADDTLVGTVGLVVKHQPEIVFLDARADQVLRALKADARTQQTTVVMVTGRADWDRRKKCIDAGAIAFVERAACLELLELLAGFVEHGRSGAAEATPASPPLRPAPAAHVP